jgi:thiamine pyrophosphokinase
MAASASTDGDTEDHLVHRYDSPFFLSDSWEQKNASPAALIILNTPIINHNNPDKGEGSYALPGVLSALWKSSSYRICADGGANRLYKATVASHATSDNQPTVSGRSYLPNLITGDLDSLLPHVQEYYEQRGVPIVRIEDQDYHDLDVSFHCAFSAFSFVIRCNIILCIYIGRRKL